MNKRVYVVSQDHADYTVTVYGYFTSRAKAEACIRESAAIEDYEREWVGIEECILDEPLPQYVEKTR